MYFSTGYHDDDGNTKKDGFKHKLGHHTKKADKKSEKDQAEGAVQAMVIAKRGVVDTKIGKCVV
jgi:hypothetical protein